MSSRFVVSLAALATFVAPLATTVDGQERHLARKRTASAGSTTITATPWIPQRTVDGQPDLRGVWGNNTATPLQRPKAWAGKEFLTGEDLAELELVRENKERR